LYGLQAVVMATTKVNEQAPNSNTHSGQNP